MALFREPKDVDFYVEDRPLTEEEQRLLKAAIVRNKAKAKRAKAKRSSSVRKSNATTKK
jgi:hypothetical protein